MFGFDCITLMLNIKSTHVRLTVLKEGVIRDMELGLNAYL
jgi:hypothetical protein